MLTLITGLPGHGKTLHAVQVIEELRLSSGRPVYYHGIPDLSLPWIHVENPAKWHELETGAIFVLDEAQTLFRVRRQGSEVPPYVAAFETHRHRGHDVYLITQHPKILDTHVRKLVGKHVHVQRLYGTQKARLHVWQKCADPDRRDDLERAQQSVITYDPKWFSVYKSAEVHTVKRELPKRWLALIASAVIGFPLLTWWGISSFSRSTEEKMAELVPGQTADNVTEAAPGVEPVKRERSRWSQAMQEPELPEFEMTKRFYEDAIRVVSFPKVAGCARLRIDRVETCECYSQQGTKLRMDQRTCRDIYEYGWFDFSKRDESERYERREETRAEPVPVSVPGLGS